MSKNRCMTVFRIFALIFLILTVRIFYFQILEGQNLAKAAISQRTTNSDIEKPRGDILDRNLIPFTNRNEKVSIVLKTLYLKDMEEDLLKVCQALDLNFYDTRRTLQLKREPVFLEIDKEKKDRIVDMGVNGVSIINSLKRYDDESTARHVLGYLNRVDQVGEAGIEKHYEDILRYDREDAVSVTTDARNNLVQGLGYRLLKLPAESKRLNVKLTLDYHIQAIVENVMKRNNVVGAVVIENVVNGDIVAMYSSPGFDQNGVEKYLNSKHNELFNRAVASYNLGSIFKIIDAAVLLEAGYDPEERYFCSGSIKIGNKEFRCSSHDKGGHGSIDFKEAFAVSCNPYFIEMGIRSGYRNLVQMAHSFGISEITGIKEQGVDESPGHLPDADSFYSNGDIANISIGQGEVMATPLQVADIVATIANGGIKNRVNIVDSVVDDDGKKIRDLRVKDGVRIIPRETADKIKQLMAEVTANGTGTKAGLEGLGGSAGKTGSAETSRKDVVHAWFGGFFPLNDPKYSIAVFIEGGKSGGDAAAPIFAEIAQEIIKKGF